MSSWETDDFASLILAQAEEEAVKTATACIEAAMAKVHFVVHLKIQSTKGLMLMSNICERFRACTPMSCAVKWVGNFRRAKQLATEQGMDLLELSRRRGDQTLALRQCREILHGWLNSKKAACMIRWRQGALGVGHKMTSARKLLQETAMRRLRATLKGILQGKIGYHTSLWRSKAQAVMQGKHVGEVDVLRRELAAMQEEIRSLQILVAQKEETVVAALLEGKEARGVLEKERSLRKSLEFELYGAKGVGNKDRGTPNNRSHKAPLSASRTPTRPAYDVPTGNLSKADIVRNSSLLQVQVRSRAGQI